MGFAGVILIGALLLMLPFCAADGRVTPFPDTLFTATSAVCVTGLVVRDTATHWSAVGQALILLMIQIGGLGVVSVAVSVGLLSGRRISLRQKSALQDSISAPKVGDVTRLIKFVLRCVLLFELVGALALLPLFCRDYGLRGIWLSVFHAVSAFCNAGFDLLGSEAARFPSLTGYVHSAHLQIVLILLIVIGGIGFLTWEDVVKYKWRFRRYRLQSKVALITSALLILLPAVYYFFFEYGADPLGQRFLNALFQAVTPRTAGFNTTDLSAMSPAGRAVMIGLMLIGGSPGSTAGGLKTTTVAVLVLNAIAAARRRPSPEIFGRRIDADTVRNAASLICIYLMLFFCAGVFISAREGLPMDVCLFETASAVGTVGLTLGLTPQLHLASRIVLMVLMYFGRVGGLTLIYAATTVDKNVSRLPQERITVG